MSTAPLHPLVAVRSLGICLALGAACSLGCQRVPFDAETGCVVDGEPTAAAGAAAVPLVTGETSAPVPSAAGAIEVIDLFARAEALARDMGDERDAFDSFFVSASTTAGMHVIGPSHRCEMHIHQTSYEATAIVTGNPEVSYAFTGPGGEARARTARLQPGAVATSPPLCGHAWVNPDATATQANLVFSSPPFDGNTFVGAEDERLRPRAEPRIYDPDLMLAALDGKEPFRRERLPVLDGKLSSLLVRTEVNLDASRSTRLLYVARGAATVAARGERRVRENDLVFLPANAPVRIHAERPSAIFLVDPEAALR